MALTLKQLGLAGNKMIKDKDHLASDKGTPVKRKRKSKKKKKV